MVKCSEPGCRKPAVCMGLYSGARCAGECEPVLEQCTDVVDDPKCKDHCSHNFVGEHCHKIAGAKQ